MAYDMDDEIAKNFKLNPELALKSIRDIARYFIVQGELRYSHLREISQHRADFYRCRLHDLDEEAGKKADKELKDAL